MILERCDNLSTIKLVHKGYNLYKKVIIWFSDNTINTTCEESDGMVVVWLGKKKIQSIKTCVTYKRTKLTENR